MSKWEPLNPWYSMSKDKDTDFGEDNSSGISIQPDHYPNVVRPGGGYPEGKGHKTDAFCNKCKDQLIDGSCLRCDWGPQNRSVPVKNFPLDPFRDDKAGIRAGSWKFTMAMPGLTSEVIFAKSQNKEDALYKKLQNQGLTINKASDIKKNDQRHNKTKGLAAWNAKNVTCKNHKEKVTIATLAKPNCPICNPQKTKKTIEEWNQDPRYVNRQLILKEMGSSSHGKGKAHCNNCGNDVSIASIERPVCPICSEKTKKTIEDWNQDPRYAEKGLELKEINFGSHGKGKAYCNNCNNEVTINEVRNPHCPNCDAAGQKARTIEEWNQDPRYAEKGLELKNSLGETYCNNCKNNFIVKNIAAPSCPTCAAPVKSKIQLIQSSILKSLRAHVKKNNKLIEAGLPPERWDMLKWLEAAGLPNIEYARLALRDYVDQLNKERNLGFERAWTYLYGGYDPNKDGYFYILQSQSAFKIGISNNLESRLKQHDKSYKDIPEYKWGPPYWQSEAVSGEIPLKTESRLKSWIRNELGIEIIEDTKGHDGYTETSPITSVPINLVGKLAQLIMENNGNVPELNENQKRELINSLPPEQRFYLFDNKLGEELGISLDFFAAQSEINPDAIYVDPKEFGSGDSAPIEPVIYQKPQISESPYSQGLFTQQENIQNMLNQGLAYQDDQGNIINSKTGEIIQSAQPIQPTSSTWKEITKHSDYEGWTNWETWNTKLMIDNEQATYEYSKEIIKQGGTAEDLANWATVTVIGPHNQQAIADAQGWNEIPYDERPTGREDISEGARDALEGLDEIFGMDPRSDETARVIDESLVNWNEIYDSIKQELQYNEQSDHEDGNHDLLVINHMQDFTAKELAEEQARQFPLCPLCNVDQPEDPDAPGDTTLPEHWGSKTADFAAGEHDGWKTPQTNIVYDNLHSDSKVGVLWELLSLFEFEENQTMPSENGKLSIQEFTDFLLKYIVGPFNQFLITVNAGETVQEDQIDWPSLYKIMEQEAVAEQEANHNELHVGPDKNPAEFRLCPICNPPQGPANPDAPGDITIPEGWS